MELGRGSGSQNDCRRQRDPQSVGLHCKKRLASFPFPARESLVSDLKIANLFLQCIRYIILSNEELQRDLNN